jgi:hypothetical protein
MTVVYPPTKWQMVNRPSSAVLNLNWIVVL